jgi:hypothetical protein
VVADAVTVEPVSTKGFPANREKNREFQESAVMGASGADEFLVDWRGLAVNSLKGRTGKISS